MHDEHRTVSTSSGAVDDRGRALSPPIQALAVARTGPAQVTETRPGVCVAGECDGLTGMARQLCHSFL